MPDVLTMYMADLFSWLADAQSHHCYGNSCPLCTVHLSQCHIYDCTSCIVSCFDHPATNNTIEKYWVPELTTNNIKDMYIHMHRRRKQFYFFGGGGGGGGGGTNVIYTATW